MNLPVAATDVFGGAQSCLSPPPLHAKSTKRNRRTTEQVIKIIAVTAAARSGGCRIYVFCFLQYTSHNLAASVGIYIIYIYIHMIPHPTKRRKAVHAVTKIHVLCATPLAGRQANKEYGSRPTWHNTNARSSSAPGFPPRPTGISDTPHRGVWLICPGMHRRHPPLRLRQLLLPAAWAWRLFRNKNM